MKFELEKEPKNPVIIEGFPGFGFVGTICTEFLIKHLDAEKIGKILSSDIKPITAIKDGKILNPFEIYYDEKHNIIILRTLGEVSDNEWDLSEMIEKLGKKLNAKEIISLEGVSENRGKIKDKIKKRAGEKTKEEDLEKEEEPKEEHKLLYFTEDKNREEQYKNAGMEKLNNGIIKGVTASLILQMEDLKIPFSSIFVRSHPNLPDSRAAGEVIKALDKYLGLEVDYHPLMDTAEEMEKKLKELFKQTKGDRKDKEGKTDYLG